MRKTRPMFQPHWNIAVRDGLHGLKVEFVTFAIEDNSKNVDYC